MMQLLGEDNLEVNVDFGRIDQRMTFALVSDALTQALG